MRWCFDTSALIEPWVRHYPPDMFGSVWARLEELARDNIIAAPTDVLIEIKRQSDDLTTWADNMNGLFVEPDRAVMERFTIIVNDHPGFIKPNSTKSGADPFVVAMAEIHGVPVVTYETYAKRDAAPKIPNVCDARGIATATFVDVLRAEGFRM